jgi:hypothetical protein
MSDRVAMIVALKNLVVPHLRKSGFTGSFPHFRRSLYARIDLITFQFDKWGGGFVIEISQCPIEGVTTHWGKHIAPNKVTAHDLHPNARFRLGTNANVTDYWFRYDNRSYDTVARTVLSFYRTAEEWWEKRFDEIQA